MRFGNPSKKNRIVSSIKGHHIEFPGKGSLTAKDLPTYDDKFPMTARTVVGNDGVVFIYVPPVMHHEVISAGMLPESEMEEASAPAVATKPEDPQALKEAAYGCFDILVAAADRESFSGNGHPKGGAIEKLLGYALTNAEIKDLWGKYLIDKKDGE